MSILHNRVGQERALRGILLLLVAVLIFAIQDVIIKFMSSDYAALEIVLIRSIFAVPIIFVILHYNGGLATLKTQQLSLQIVRGLVMFLAYIFFFLAIAALPYSLTLAIFFAGPLFITALSVPILKEPVGWRRWSAVLIGFLGVMVIINPGGASFDPAVFLALGAAFTYAISIILTRIIKDSAPAMAAYTTGMYLLSALILSPVFANLQVDTVHPSILFLTKAWTMPLPKDILLIFIISLCWGVGMVLLSAAYRSVSAALLAPFEYFSIFYGILFGYLFWHEVPTTAMLIGLTLIVGSGLFIIYRENKVPSQ